MSSNGFVSVRINYTQVVYSPVSSVSSNGFVSVRINYTQVVYSPVSSVSSTMALFLSE